VVALVFNFLVVFAEPDVGKHGLLQNGEETALIGNWRGFMAHKNFAGAACALTILLFTFDARGLVPKVRIAVIALAAIFLFKSSSKTSAGMALIAMASAYAFQHVSPKLRIYVIPALALLSTVVGVLMSLYGDALSSALANPMVFTGRGVIWAALINYTRDNPICGAGFGSFWNIGFDSPIYQYGKGFATQVTVGHNGYLDLAATVGIPGVLLITFGLIVWPLIRLLTSQAARSEVGALICAVIVFGVGHNVTESSMFARDAIVGVFMLFAVAFTATMSLPVGERSKPQQGKRGAGDELMRTMRKRKRTA
jgi:exopolysaccharide production protein ExoQ